MLLYAFIYWTDAEKKSISKEYDESVFTPDSMAPLTPFFTAGRLQQTVDL